MKLHLAPSPESLLTLMARQHFSLLPQECSLLPVGSCASPLLAVWHAQQAPSCLAAAAPRAPPRMGGAGLGHCTPLVADPELLSTGGCIHVADKALISSSACPSITLQLFGWRIPADSAHPGASRWAQDTGTGFPYSLIAWPIPKPWAPRAHNKDARFSCHGGERPKEKKQDKSSGKPHGGAKAATGSLVLAAVLSREDAPATTTAATSQPCCQHGQDSHRASALDFPCRSSLGKWEEETDLFRVPGASSQPSVP